MIDLSGEQEAFCRREHPRLVAAVTAYTGDGELARECAQEALGRACARWGRVREMERPGGWLLVVAMNLAKRRLGRRRRRRQAVEQKAAQRAEDVPADTAEAMAVRQAVATLPPRQRQAVALRFLGDLDVSETAKVMGCRPGTVKALTHQALAALRQHGGLAPSDVPADPIEEAEDG